MAKEWFWIFAIYLLWHSDNGSLPTGQDAPVAVGDGDTCDLRHLGSGVLTTLMQGNWLRNWIRCCSNQRHSQNVWRFLNKVASSVLSQNNRQVLMKNAWLLKNCAPSILSGNIERLSWLRRTFSLFFSKLLKKFHFIR